MTQRQRVGSLEIDQDLAFERREWRLQRAGWIIMLLIVLAGLAGALGPGLFSRTASSSGPLSITYERTLRKRTPSELHISLAPSVAQAGTAMVWLDQTYLDKIAIERITPAPAASIAAGDRVFFRFTLAPSAQASTITFALMPAEPGFVHASAGLRDGPPVSLDQFVLP